MRVTLTSLWLMTLICMKHFSENKSVFNINQIITLETSEITNMCNENTFTLLQI